ncbi:MAG: helix-turn-helix transcriptional regulator [Clostridiales bacterium]|nr:helix-turn-helix transcriptional regulator [Clostridiales bacterium]
MQSFGEKLKTLRQQRGLSQKQLAVLSGVSPSYLSRIERGERNIPHPSALVKLAGPLGINEYEILAFAGYITGAMADIPRHWHSLMADPSLDNMLRQLGDLSNQEKQSLNLYLQAIRLERENN